MNLDELRKQAREALELAEKATPGEWYFDDEGAYGYRVRNPTGHILFETFGGLDTPQRTWNNAELCAASRTLVPDLANKLLEALDELEGRIADAKTHAEAMKLSAQQKFMLERNLDFAHNEWAKDLQERNDLRAEMVVLVNELEQMRQERDKYRAAVHATFDSLQHFLTTLAE